jgi:hypothetical protein
MSALFSVIKLCGNRIGEVVQWSEESCTEVNIYISPLDFCSYETIMANLNSALVSNGFANTTVHVYNQVAVDKRTPTEMEESSEGKYEIGHQKGNDLVVTIGPMEKVALYPIDVDGKCNGYITKYTNNQVAKAYVYCSSRSPKFVEAMLVEIKNITEQNDILVLDFTICNYEQIFHVLEREWFVRGSNVFLSHGYIPAGVLGNDLLQPTIDSSGWNELLYLTFASKSKSKEVKNAYLSARRPKIKTPGYEINWSNLQRPLLQTCHWVYYEEKYLTEQLDKMKGGNYLKHLFEWNRKKRNKKFFFS